MRIWKHYLALGLALCLAAAALVGPVAHAQDGEEPTGFTNVRLWLYPEYDQPRFLMMMEGDVTGTTLPTTVRFIVPDDAELFSAGYKDDGDQYYRGTNLDIEGKPSSIPGYKEISFEIQEETFRIEYYDSSIIGDPDKTVAFQLNPLYPISDLTVYAQEPGEASNFVVAGEGASQKVFDDGFQSDFPAHLFNYLGLPAGEPLDFQISYTKTDPNPSVASAPLSNDPGGASGSAGGIGTGMAIGIAVASLVALGAGAYWVYGNRQRQPSSRSRRRANRRAVRRNQPSRAEPRAPRSGGEQAGGRRPKFCSDCGAPLDPGARFCPGCGTKL
jgi:hypothetical protein